MHPSKVKRDKVKTLLDLPNVGPATAGDLKRLGILKPEQLAGQNAFAMHERLCVLTQTKHDPCVIDVFLSLIHFANGGEPKPWWDFTEQRKRILAACSGELKHEKDQSRTKTSNSNP